MDEYDRKGQNTPSTNLIKKCCLTGSTPWGFRIMTDLSSILTPGILSNIVVSRVRSRSKAYFGGLKEGDVLLFINDFPTYSLTLEAATNLIESANDLNLVVSTETSPLKRPFGRSGSVCSAIGIGNRFNSTRLKNSTSIDQSINNNLNNPVSTPSSTKHQKLLFSRDLFNESKAYLQNLERTVNEKRRGSSGSIGGGPIDFQLKKPSNNSINPTTTSNTSLSLNNNNNNNNQQNNLLNSNGSSINQDYLIKPVSLKSLKKIELDNFTKFVHNAPACFATTPTSILDFSSLLLNSPTTSITSTTTTATTSTPPAISIPDKTNHPLLRMASDPSRLYNNLPSQQQQHGTTTITNYKLEAQQLVKKYCRGGSGNKLKLYCSATDHEDEEEKRLRSRRQYYSLLKNGNANSLRNYHKLCRKAYSSATESYGEEEEAHEGIKSVNYPSEYGEKLHNNQKTDQSRKNKLPNFRYHEITDEYNNFLSSSCSENILKQQPRDSSNSSRISYATITLCQPKTSPTTSSLRKELNYFSDTEAVHSGVHRVFRLKNSSSISLMHNTANNYSTPNNNHSSNTNINQATALNSSSLNLPENSSNLNISKAAINRTSSLTYRDLSSYNNNNINNRLQQQLPTYKPTQTTTALNKIDSFIKKSDSLFNNTSPDNNSNRKLNLKDQKQHQPRLETLRKSASFNQNLLEALPNKMTSISQFMKSNMLPEFPAHGEQQQQPIQYNNSYNNQAKGFVSQYNPSQQGQHQSSYTSMPIKWTPASQQQHPQPQQNVPMHQYQQQQHDYQQDYQSDYHEEYTPKPDPQLVYQKSLAQSRQQQNEYLAEMQRNQDYNNYDEDEEYQQYAQMGTGIGFAPKKNTPKYADSYFYNSPDMKYPTINDQKKLARSIAATLEGSNTASKYHKKKETINRQLAADDEEYNTQNSGYYQPQNDYYTQHQHQQQQFSYHHKGHGTNNVALDDSVPDVIKRSIAQANMSNPLNNVQAPEHFKEAHLQAEANSHTQCPPSEAINLAHALENSSFEQRGKGGKGTILFQKRKARMEKLAHNEEERQAHLAQNVMFNHQQYQPQQPVNPNDNFRPQQHQTPIHFQHQQRQPVEVKKQPQPQQYSQQHQQVEVEESHYRIPNVGTNGSYSKFSNNFNIKPKGWGSVSAPQSHTSSVQMPSYEQHNSNRLDLDQWNNPNRPHQQQQEYYEPAPVMSKTGVNNLKGMLYEQPQHSSYNLTPKSSTQIVSSHDNHLFNSRTSTQQITLNTSSKNTSVVQPSQAEPRMQQHTVHFQIGQPNQNRAEQSQQNIVKPQQTTANLGGSIKYQIFDENDIAASDL